MSDYIHAIRVFLHAWIRLRYSVRESYWWAQRSMIGPDDWPIE